MILIADGGSTKADWIALDNDSNEVFRVRTLGLNPAVVAQKELANRIINMFQLMDIKEEITEIYFYGAGCGTPKPFAILKKVLQDIFVNAKINIAEDMLAAVYAASGNQPAIVCILGTGSNSCYYDGTNVHMKTVSLGYSVMDEASGNYFGKLLLREYFYDKMPKRIADKFEEEYNLDADVIKYNLYKQPNPNMYLDSRNSCLNLKKINTLKRSLKEGLMSSLNIEFYPLVNQRIPQSTLLDLLLFTSAKF